MNKIAVVLIFIVAVLPAGIGNVHAQLNGNSLTEYQLGNIPDIKPADMSSLYNQLNLQYRNQGLRASMRIEQFYTNDSIDRKYILPTQWQVGYKYKRLEFKAGHFFETLGRGLLFRSFEIPASVKEERTFRVRHGFYRDIQGAMLNYKGKTFRIKALYGKPLQNSYPPGNELQRVETIEAIQPELNKWRQTVGIIVMRHSSQGIKNLYGSTYVKGLLPWNFSYYGEYARNLSLDKNPVSFKDDDAWGGYFSISHSYGNYGSSLEIKNYHNFLIGSGISDPPTLVKEQSYRLLNRSTHLTELRDEKGYQLEVFYTFNDGKMISFNHAMAVNDLYGHFIFREFFMEYYWPFPRGSSMKTFMDFAGDELTLEKQRVSSGIYYTQVLNKDWSVKLESEWQQIKSGLTDSENITNLFLGLVLSRSTRFSISLSYEYTNDPVFADRSSTTERETVRNYLGLAASYRPNSNHAFNLFIGERRGGPACNSGICYEVLDFRGIEFRWTIKFT